LAERDCAFDVSPEEALPEPDLPDFPPLPDMISKVAECGEERRWDKWGSSKA
jgi:hypothetical protein